MLTTAKAENPATAKRIGRLVTNKESRLRGPAGQAGNLPFDGRFNLAQTEIRMSATSPHVVNLASSRK